MPLVAACSPLRLANVRSAAARRLSLERTGAAAPSPIGMPVMNGTSDWFNCSAPSDTIEFSRENYIGVLIAIGATYSLGIWADKLGCAACAGMHHRQSAGEGLDHCIGASIVVHGGHIGIGGGVD